MTKPLALHAFPSRLGLSLEGYSDWETRRATVRRAWDLGLRVLDLSLTPEPLGTLERIRLRFPEIVDDGLIVLSPVQESPAPRPLLPEPPAAENVEGPAEFATAALRVLGTPAIDFFSIPWGRHEKDSAETALASVDRLVRENRLRGWGADFGDLIGESDAREALRRGAFGAFIRANLLRPGALVDHRAWESSITLPLLIRDPFDQGRLSGELLTQRSLPELALRGPIPVTDLERTFRPVLRFKFLTEGRKRTLAQAALQFLLQDSAVACVLLPEAGPDRLAEWAASADREPLTQDQLDRILSGSSEPPHAPRERLDGTAR
ncbi:MAG: hypothetical protein WCA77_07700 [Thermoplasmata archaeon]